MHIKKKDQVRIISGKDKNKTGEVLKVFPSKNSVLVNKINMVKKNVKATKENAGGIIERESPLKVSKLMLVCVKCNKATRIKNDILSDGKKVRICKKCGEIII